MVNLLTQAIKSNEQRKRDTENVDEQKITMENKYNHHHNNNNNYI